MQHSISLLSLMIALGAVAPSISQGTARVETVEIEIAPDVIYGHKLGMALTLDVLKPAKPNGAAVLFMVSGGWRSRWIPAERSARTYSWLLDRGFTVVPVRHGSSPKFVIPEIVADVRRAVRFVRAHAKEWRIDPEKIGVFGGSAGGHLSLMLGTASDAGAPDARDPIERESSRVAAVVAYYPPTDLRQLVPKPPKNGQPARQNRRFPALNFDYDKADDHSPIVHVSKDDPPTLLIHGDKDRLVPLANSERMHASLAAASVPCELLVLKGAGHGFRGADRARSQEATAKWF